MNRNILREFVKVISGNFAGYFLLEAIHTLSVPLIAFIQLVFFYLYYLVWSALFDRIERVRVRKGIPKMEDELINSPEMSHNNGIRELAKVLSGYVTGCILLELIHAYPVLAITIIQMVYFYFYYLSLAILFDRIESRFKSRKSSAKSNNIKLRMIKTVRDDICPHSLLFYNRFFHH